MAGCIADGFDHESVRVPQRCELGLACGKGEGVVGEGTGDPRLITCVVLRANQEEGSQQVPKCLAASIRSLV